MMVSKCFSYCTWPMTYWDLDISSGIFKVQTGVLEPRSFLALRTSLRKVSAQPFPSTWKEGHCQGILISKMVFCRVKLCAVAIIDPEKAKRGHSVSPETGVASHVVFGGLLNVNMSFLRLWSSVSFCSHEERSPESRILCLAQVTCLEVSDFWASKMYCIGSLLEFWILKDASSELKLMQLKHVRSTCSNCGWKESLVWIMVPILTYASCRFMPFGGILVYEVC